MFQLRDLQIFLDFHEYKLVKELTNAICYMQT